MQSINTYVVKGIASEKKGVLEIYTQTWGTVTLVCM